MAWIELHADLTILAKLSCALARARAATYAARIERLTPEEFSLLREAVAKHRPDLLPLVDEAVNVRILTNREGNDLRMACALEISPELDEYSVKMDDLIDRIARMMEGM